MFHKIEPSAVQKNKDDAQSLILAYCNYPGAGEKFQSTLAAATMGLIIEKVESLKTAGRAIGVAREVRGFLNAHPHYRATLMPLLKRLFNACCVK